MNETSIINYPGSKKKLLDFIYTNTYKYIDKNKYVLDIFLVQDVLAICLHVMDIKLLVMMQKIFILYI